MDPREMLDYTDPESVEARLRKCLDIADPDFSFRGNLYDRDKGENQVSFGIGSPLYGLQNSLMFGDPASITKCCLGNSVSIEFDNDCTTLSKHLYLGLFV